MVVVGGPPLDWGTKRWAKVFGRFESYLVIDDFTSFSKIYYAY